MPNVKLTDYERGMIRRDWERGDKSYRELAEYFGVSHMAIYRVINPIDLPFRELKPHQVRSEILAMVALWAYRDFEKIRPEEKKKMGELLMRLGLILDYKRV